MGFVTFTLTRLSEQALPGPLLHQGPQVPAGSNARRMVQGLDFLATEHSLKEENLKHFVQAGNKLPACVQQGISTEMDSFGHPAQLDSLCTISLEEWLFGWMDLGHQQSSAGVNPGQSE